MKNKTNEQQKQQEQINIFNIKTQDENLIFFLNRMPEQFKLEMGVLK